MTIKTPDDKGRLSCGVCGAPVRLKLITQGEHYFCPHLKQVVVSVEPRKYMLEYVKAK